MAVTTPQPSPRKRLWQRPKEAPKDPAVRRPLPGNPVYVDLGDSYPKGYLWSNDPADMNLDAYFDPGKYDLATEYGVEGLKPVLKKTDTEDYPLTADDGKFYIWAIDDGRLFVCKEELDMTLEKVIEKACRGVCFPDLIEV